MDMEREKQLDEISNGIEELRDKLGDIHKKLHNVSAKLDPLEKDVMKMGEHKIEFAIRDAYIKLVDAGRYLTQVHLDISIPPTIFEREKEKTIQEEKEEQEVQS